MEIIIGLIVFAIFCVIMTNFSNKTIDAKSEKSLVKYKKKLLTEANEIAVRENLSPKAKQEFIRRRQSRAETMEASLKHSKALANSANAKTSAKEMVRDFEAKKTAHFKASKMVEDYKMKTK